MPTKATDPELLKELNTPTRATDPELVKILKGAEPHPSQTDDGAFTMTFAPFRFDPKNDVGNDAAVSAALRFGPTPAAAVAYLRSRGISLAVPKAITDVLEANDRGMAGANDTEGGQSQRTQDALTVSTSMLGLPPGSAALTKTIPAAAAREALSPASSTAAAGVGSREAALQAAERIGIDVPEAAAGGYIKRSLGAALRDAPVVGQPLVDASEKALGQLEGVATKVADELGGSSALSAGYALSDDLVKWVKVSSKEEAAEIYAPARKLIGNTKAPLSRTGVALREITKDAQAIGLKPPAIVAELQGSVAKEMTFDEMQRLRTNIGQRLSGKIKPEAKQDDIALKTVYASLSDDLDFLAGKAGDKAKAAWRQANDAFKSQIVKKRDALTKVVGIEGEANPELVAERLTKMASAKRGADIDRLRAARETVGDEAWGELSSSVVADLGRTPDGFSVAKYRADYSKLSDEGKTLLFSPEHKQSLDDIATVSRRFVQLDKLANHSRTAVGGGIMAGGYMIINKPLQLLASMVGGRTLASMLARPATAKAVSQWMKAHEAVAVPVLSASASKVTEEAIRARQDANYRLRDALDREGINFYPPISALSGDQPVRDDEENDTP